MGWKEFIFAFLLGCPFLLQAQAQEDDEGGVAHNLRLGVEAGVNMFGGSSTKPDRIRESNSSYTYEDATYNTSGTDVEYIGAKAEYFVWNNRIGLAVGLRFSHSSTTFDTKGEYFM
ncbi:hypothetical protein FACS1894199_06590 [Bacteroidia bacterium]|nr:hypothetical protein FACS1894199_06590 [Bacteroidia bacterium]